MKRKFILLIAALLLYHFAMAQPSCNCEDALQKIIRKIESEYPGFETKTKDKLLYSSVKEKAIEASRSAIDSSCLQVLKAYVDFFKDRHIWILGNETARSGTAVTRQSKLLNINLDQFRQEAARSQNRYEGIWKNNAYEIGIRKIDNNEYAGFIIAADPQYWKPREIKFRLFTNGRFEYFMQDRSVEQGTYTIDQDGFLYFKEIAAEFVRQAPGPGLSDQQILHKINDIYGFSIKRVTGKTTLLTLPNFSYPFVKGIESLLESNKALLQSSDFLIVDIRGNSGGTDLAYQSLLPYLSTNPIRSIGVEYLASPTLISTTENYRKTVTDKEELADLDKRLALYKAHAGKYVMIDKSIVTMDTIIPVNNSPKQVVILTDQSVGSAAENLVLISKQSKKVKLMGTPTSGVLDYANAMFFDYGCNDYKLLMPTYRSLRLPGFPIDNIGLQPDIYLDKSVPDWVKYAVDYLEN